MEDINKITGYNPNNVGVYDPNQTGTGTKYAVGALNEYENKVTYYWDGTNYPYYIATNGVTGNLTSSHNNSLYGNSFYWYDSNSGWKSSQYTSTTNRQEITTLESNYYSYYPNTLTSSSSGTTVGIDTTSTAYKMLFTNSSTGAYTSGSGSTTGFIYWLGSLYVYTNTDVINFGVRTAGNGNVAGGQPLYRSAGFPYSYNSGVRPVVSLESGISLTDSGTIYDGCTLWNIG